MADGAAGRIAAPVRLLVLVTLGWTPMFVPADVVDLASGWLARPLDSTLMKAEAWDGMEGVSLARFTIYLEKKKGIAECRLDATRSSRLATAPPAHNAARRADRA